MAMPSSLKDEETGGGDGVPDRHDDPELLLAPGDTDDRSPHAPVTIVYFLTNQINSYLVSFSKNVSYARIATTYSQ